MIGLTFRSLKCGSELKNHPFSRTVNYHTSCNFYRPFVHSKLLNNHRVIPTKTPTSTKQHIFWLMVWNMAFIFHNKKGMSSFPLTNSIIFQDGYCTTNQRTVYHYFPTFSYDSPLFLGDFPLKPPTRLNLKIGINIIPLHSASLTGRNTFLGAFSRPPFLGKNAMLRPLQKPGDPVTLGESLTVWCLQNIWKIRY